MTAIRGSDDRLSNDLCCNTWQSVRAPESATAAHDASLAMAIISWDPQGRKLLMQVTSSFFINLKPRVE